MGENQAVFVTLKLAGGHFGSDDERKVIRALEHDISAAIDAAGTGEYDGDEFGGGEVVLYMYGPDADALFATVEPLLRREPRFPGHAIVRYGESGTATPRRQVDL
ncbi:hypothetical protein [Actinokineospora diospyrosa]|uniref:Uncharacterized protein n=1 Tax=Actinokineospora diospyrosa TaxID=103728 RepID=A0ABT1INA0_9PSEU|nr:hypothetical protein [Actinokineospora diospyrosa]MCP2274147.1 hypothetical protein [Actinokineospora diospyrosa]